MLTVITPAITQNLTTVDALKAELNITDSSQDARLLNLIAAASGVVADYCRRVFGLEEVEETLRPDRPLDTLILARFPVTEIVSLTVCDVALSAAQYELNAANGTMIRLENDQQRWWGARGKIVARYKAGFQLLDGLPYGVERAAIGLTTKLYLAAGRDPLVKGEDVPGVGSYQYWVGGVGDNGALPPDVIAMLRPHRDLRVR